MWRGSASLFSKSPIPLISDCLFLSLLLFQYTFYVGAISLFIPSSLSFPLWGSKTTPDWLCPVFQLLIGGTECKSWMTCHQLEDGRVDYSKGCTDRMLWMCNVRMRRKWAGRESFSKVLCYTHAVSCTFLNYNLTKAFSKPVRQPKENMYRKKNWNPGPAH